MPSAFAVGLQRIATNLQAPLYLTSPPGDASRLFVLEKNSGRVQIIRASDRQLLPQPFLTVDNLSRSGEQGLLGIAFHPNYASNGQFFISLTNRDGDSEIRRYTRSANPNLASASSKEVLLTIPQFATNHNGGWIGFGPDGFLYIASGDGGGSNDPRANGQDLTSLLGSMLRIDVNGDDFPNNNARNYRIPSSNPFVGVNVGGEPARGEIWAYGLRNPWRASFDRQTGDLIIGDVGQGAREEINFQSASSQGGENYGWRLREGEIPTPGVGGARPADNVDPIYTYSRSGNNFTGRSVTGGYRYRGSIAELRGRYFFADFVNGRIWSLRPRKDGFSDLVFWSSDRLPIDRGELNNVASFGEDANGELYIIDFGGDIFKFVSNSQPEPVDPTSPTDPANPNAVVVPAINLLLDD